MGWEKSKGCRGTQVSNALWALHARELGIPRCRPRLPAFPSENYPKRTAERVGFFDLHVYLDLFLQTCIDFGDNRRNKGVKHFSFNYLSF